MKSRNMEGGYVSEGGQLKAINGQKYIFNQSREGYFLTKSCAILWGVLAILTMILIFLLTYFLLAPSCQSVVPKENGSVHFAGIVSNGREGKETENNKEIIESTTTITTLELTSEFLLQLNNTTEGTMETIMMPQSSSTFSDYISSTEKQVEKKIGKKNIKPVDEEILIDIEDEDISDEIDDLPGPTTGDEIVLAEGWNPSHYSLIIEPNYGTANSNGSIEIDITNDRKYDELQFIILDIKDIIISEPIIYQILPNQDIKQIIFDSFYGEDYQTYTIQLNDELCQAYFRKEISLKIYLKFVSKLTDTLQGFYRTSYMDDLTGNVTWLASTQFSPIDARRAFPCFDRPDKKANFKITVVRDESKGMTLSNMPSRFISKHRPGYIQETFDVTPKMSSYLVAFIVSDLIKTNNSIDVDQNLPEINIWTRPEVANMTNYAYTLTKNVLHYLNNYFGIFYNLPKIDMVAVPDFGFSAMENWGLITFRESALLVPENKVNGSSAEHTERVSSIISHELAHQWFGNLVTMKWWDDLWLKEGFAVFMSYECIENIQPDWRVLEKFAIIEMEKSMEKDSDKSSHPISFPVNSQSDIRRIFDPISYSKGAIIIRMMRSFLGEKAFKSGLTEYLHKFKYSNAVHDDLWQIMTSNGHKYETLPLDLEIKDIMDTWTLQAGYPVISLSRNGSDLVISQQRYMLPQTDLDDQSKWFIPISYASQEDPDRSEIPTHWLTDKQKTITIPGVMKEKDWLYVNVNRTGYYRVNYDYDSWRGLSLAYRELPEIIRGKIIDDALNLARVELVSYDIPLTFLIRMGHVHNDYLAWSAASKGIEYLIAMISREPAFESFKAAMRFIGKMEFDRLSFDIKPDESHIELLHKSRIIKHACFFGHDRCTNKAQLIYRNWMTSPTVHQINPNLKDSIYCVALREGGTQEWYYALKRYRETNSASEKEIILNALGCTTKPWLLSKYLNMTISSSSGIRKQDGARAFTAVAKNFIGYEIAFDFLVTNIKEISEYFGDGFSTLSKMIDSVTTYMNKDYQLEQFEKFAKKAGKLQLTAIKKSIELAKEQVKNNIVWRSKSYYHLQGYLDALVRDLNINIY